MANRIQRNIDHENDPAYGSEQIETLRIAPKHHNVNQRHRGQRSQHPTDNISQLERDKAQTADSPSG